MTEIEEQIRRRLSTMITRCYNKNTLDYPRYGGSGVTICQEWLDDPKAFIEWSLASGFHKDLTIDKDILCDKLEIFPKVYSPDTCKWITRSENSSYANSTREYDKVVQYDLNGKYICTYDSIAQAGLRTNTTSSNISRVCSLSRYTANNFQWRFEIDDIDMLPPVSSDRHKKGKAVYQICKASGNILKSFSSALEAAQAMGVKSGSAIAGVCSKQCLPSGNIRQTAYGFKWVWQ